MTESRFLVYGLIDPETNKVRYVGASTQGMKRPLQHWTPYYLRTEGRTHKTNWLQSLLKRGLIPQVFILEECAGADEVYESEQSWICYLKSRGAPLTNLADGGAGSFGCARSEETKRKMSEAKLGIPRSPEARAKMSASQRAREKSPEELEHIRALGAAWKGRTRSAETRERMAAAKRGKSRSPETVAKMAASLKARERTPEELARMRLLGLAQKGKTRSAETRARMAESQRQRWALRKSGVEITRKSATTDEVT